MAVAIRWLIRFPPTAGNWPRTAALNSPRLIAAITRGLADTVSAARQVSDSAGCAAAPAHPLKHRG